MSYPHPALLFLSPHLIPWSQRGSSPLPVGPWPSPSSCPFLRVTAPPSPFPPPRTPPSFFLFPRISAMLTSPGSALSSPHHPQAPGLGRPFFLPGARLLRAPPPSPFYLPAHPEDLPARTGPDSSAPVCHLGSGPPVAVDGLTGGTIPLPAGPHLHQVLAVHEHWARRRAQHLSAALLLAQVAKTEPLSPRAKE